MMTLKKNNQSPLLQLSKPKELSHGMKIYPTQDAFSFKIMEVQTPFGPSVFNGTGEEERQNLLFSISEEDQQQIKSLEADIYLQLQDKCPDIASRWTSCLKDATDKWPATLRTKINLKGTRTCKFLGAIGDTTPPPESWRLLSTNAVIRIGGAYLQARGAGLLVEVTHLQYAAQPPMNPFA